MTDERLLLDDIIAALDRIDSYTKGQTFESFVSDRKTIDAVTYNLLAISETACRLPGTLTDAYPEIPWRQVAGLREVLVQPGFPADYRLMWKTTTIVLPFFRSIVETMQKDFPDRPLPDHKV
jgi:uncharacterized protein with HEPN domain